MSSRSLAELSEREVGLVTMGGDLLCRDPCCTTATPFFKLGTTCPQPGLCRESLYTVLLAGCWGGGRADRNITHIFKAPSPSPRPGFLLKVVLHSLETSWDVDRH